jgi:hypothetical protein
MVWMALGSPGPAAAATQNINPADPVRRALARESFPWYDATSGRVKPILSRLDFGSGWLKRVGEWIDRVGRWLARPFRALDRWRLPGLGHAGDLIAIGLALLLLTLVLVLLLELLRRYRPLADEEGNRIATGRAGIGGRLEGLPMGDTVDLTDPWGMAQRLRDRGDYAGAVVHLFAHQLLTLSSLGQLRLVPGRTGRQLVRAIDDGRLRAQVRPTLELFEAVYYGQHVPTAEAFEGVWTHALAFQESLAAEALS